MTGEGMTIGFCTRMNRMGVDATRFLPAYLPACVLLEESVHPHHWDTQARPNTVRLVQPINLSLLGTHSLTFLSTISSEGALLRVGTIQYNATHQR